MSLTLSTDQHSDLLGDLGISQSQQSVVLTGNVTAGTFTLSFEGYTTGNIAFDASAGDVQDALEDLPTIGAGNVLVTGQWAINFIEVLSYATLSPITVDPTNLVGGSAVVIIVSVFTEAAFNRLYNRAVGDYDLTVVLALRQLLIPNSRLFDYTIGRTSVKRSQVFKNLRDLLKDRETIAGIYGGPIKKGVMSHGLDARDEFAEDEDNA